jgi:putative transposase
LREPLRNGILQRAYQTRQFYRALAVIDHWSREGLAIEVDRIAHGRAGKRVLERLRASRGLPGVILTDNRPEFTGGGLDQWADDNKVRLQFIEPGKPMQNAFIESFNPKNSIRHQS